MMLQTQSKRPTVIFNPLMNDRLKMPSSQFYAMTCPADDILLWGNRGGGKTITQLMWWLQWVGWGYGEFYKGLFYDKSYKALQDAVSQSMIYFPKLGGRFLRSATEYMWVFPKGERLLFRHLEKPSDYDNVHGHQFPKIMGNEAGKYGTREVYDLLHSINRNGFKSDVHTPIKMNYYGETFYKKDGSILYDTPTGELLPPLQDQFFITANTSHAGRFWLKKQFIDASPIGTMTENTEMVEGREVKRSQIAIMSSWVENLKHNGGYLDDAYVVNLKRATRGNRNLLKSWVYGSWDVSSGGAFDDLWDSNRHILPRFKVPSTWKLDRTMDWGSRSPFSIGWWAEADGTYAVLPDGRHFCPPKGSLIRFYEWYGSHELGSNEGLKLKASDVARGVIKIEQELKKQKWVLTDIKAGPADNQIASQLNLDSPSIEAIMEKEGVRWTKSDKSSGSRVLGVGLMRERLQNVIEGEGEGIYCMNNCKAFIHFIPHLPVDEKNIEDVDTKCEDHVFDEVRYRLLDRKSIVRTVPVFGRF